MRTPLAPAALVLLAVLAAGGSAVAGDGVDVDLWHRQLAEEAVELAEQLLEDVDVLGQGHQGAARPGELGFVRERAETPPAD